MGNGTSTQPRRVEPVSVTTHPATAATSTNIKGKDFIDGFFSVG